MDENVRVVAKETDLVKIVCEKILSRKDLPANTYKVALSAVQQLFGGKHEAHPELLSLLKGFTIPVPSDNPIHSEMSSAIQNLLQLLQ